MWYARNKFYSETVEENLQEAKIVVTQNPLGQTTLILTVRSKSVMQYHSFDFQRKFFPLGKSWHSLNPIMVLDVTAASNPPPEFILSPRYDNCVTVSTYSCNFSFLTSTFL